MSYNIDSEENNIVRWTLIIGTALSILCAFVFSNFHIYRIIAEKVFPRTGFSSFFYTEDEPSILLMLSLLFSVLGSIIGGLVGIVRGIMGKKWGWGLFGISVLVFLFGAFVLRFFFVLLGYLIWVLCSPIAIILFMLSMLIISAKAIKEMCLKKGKVAATWWLIADLVFCSLLCAIAFRYMFGNTTEDMIVWVIRIFV